MRTISKLSVSKEWVGHKGPTGRTWYWTHRLFLPAAVKHCGHPTALRPYYIYGSRLPGGVGFYTFRTLKQAQWWVEHGGHLLEDEDKAGELYQEMIASE